jgi:hypothetical protein
VNTAPTTASFAAYRAAIDNAITSQPRSLQRVIGPSEIGTPCDHCLAAKLAGWEQTRDAAWLPAIGTAVHEWLDTVFTLANHPTFRWSTEKRVMVGHIAGQEIWGSTDLFDHDTRTVIDHKIVGKSTLDNARRHGPSPTYRTQAHLYGMGWINAGQPVTDVAIAYLPRQAVSLDQAVLWHEPHQPHIATQALERATQLATTLTGLAAISTAARDAYITGLPRHDGCFDCSRFPDRPTTPSALEQLIA